MHPRAHAGPENDPMYATPLLAPIHAGIAQAICCEVTIRDRTFPTPGCAVPWCEMFEQCSVSVGPVTVSG
jgi:hypothetical protein